MMNHGFEHPPARLSPHMNPFNLVTSDWIPVRMADGTSRLASLDAAFREGHEIADLDCAPHERISLMRLLVCITHAALGAPDSPEDWGDFGDELENAAPDYLHRPDILPHFNLLGEGPRFLQVPLKKTKQKPLLAFLEFKFASNPTLFDHGAGEERTMSPERLALNLLTFQNFFIGGGMGSAANGGVTGNGPALKFLHTFIIGCHLRETIRLNLLNKSAVSDFGRPLWEQPNAASPNDLLARLAPSPCKIWLNSTNMWICQGLEYSLESGAGAEKKLVFRDPFATMFGTKDGVRFLRTDPSRALWRDLHLISELKAIEKFGEMAAPLNLLSHAPNLSGNDFTLWAGELIKGEKAVVVDAIESTFTIPKAMLSTEGHALYHAGVDFAEWQSSRLRDAVKEFGKAMKCEHPPVAAAQRHFWHALDRDYEVLLDLVRDGSPMKFEERGNPWGDLVREAARKAYDHACPRQTPRQIQAFAAGLKKLPISKTKPSKEKQ
jgi:CRISPR system Cascade subunit CasA